jgi:hypothetical protein
MTEAVIKVFLLSVGRRGFDNQRRIANAFHLLTADEAQRRYAEGVEDRPVMAYKKLSFPLGSIVEVEAKDAEASTVFYNTARLVGRWDSEDDLVRWKSYDAAWADWWEGKQALARAKAENPLLDALAPIREAYRRLPNVQKAHLLAKVVAYLVR